MDDLLPEEIAAQIASLKHLVEHPPFSPCSISRSYACTPDENELPSDLNEPMFKSQDVGMVTPPAKGRSALSLPDGH